jgi:hypothetical protein
MPIWETEQPKEKVDVLAEVITGFRITLYRVLRWVPGRGWYIEGSLMTNSDKVLRWTLLQPLITERPDKRVPGVTTLVELLKELNGGALDNSGMARKHCHTLINQFKAQYPDRDPVELVERFIRAVKQHHYHGLKATSMGYLVRYRLTIINDLSNVKQQGSASKFAQGRAALGYDQG